MHIVVLIHALMVCPVVLATPPTSDLEWVATLTQPPPSTTDALTRANKEPKLGIGKIIGGAGALAYAAGSTVTLPICLSEGYKEIAGERGSDICTGTTVVLGVAALAAGVPLLISGLSDHREWTAWRESRGVAGVAIDPRRQALAVTWRGTF